MILAIATGFSLSSWVPAMLFFRRDEQLDRLGDRVLEATWREFAQLAQTEIALTWIVYDNPVPVNTGGALTPQEFWRYSVRGFAYRGVERLDPARMVTLFYLVAAHEWLDKGMIPPSSELDRALQDMIVESNDDATSLVVDVLTGTTSGPELPPEPFETWKYQRNIVNRYMQSLGWIELESININQKTWSSGPYGRERAFLGALQEHRNGLTTNATARLLHSIIGGVAVSSPRSQTMMALLKRHLHSTEPIAQSTAQAIVQPNNQIVGGLGEGLPATAQLWSKASKTRQLQHEAAYIEVPGLRPYLLVVFLEGSQVQNAGLLPFISRQVVAAVSDL